MNLFERIYRSCHQLPYADIASDGFFHHIYLCFKDPLRLREMSNKIKRKTRLPMNIWIDEGESYIAAGHWKRIKFQKDRGNKINWNNLGEMDFDGNLIKSTIFGCELSNKELLQLKNFIFNNKEILDLASDSIITGDDFSDLMIIGGELASEQEKRDQQKELKLILEGINI